jgi:hypothetical protein
MNEHEQLALAHRIIRLAREYVLHDPHVKPRGSYIHRRTSADIERHENLRDELGPLFAEWVTRLQEREATDEERACAYEILREARHPMRSDES